MLRRIPKSMLWLVALIAPGGFLLLPLLLLDLLRKHHQDRPLLEPAERGSLLETAPPSVAS